MSMRESLLALIAGAEERLKDRELPAYQREYFENMLLDYKEQLKKYPPEPEEKAPFILRVIKGGKL